jgi:hypothetical protein
MMSMGKTQDHFYLCCFAEASMIRQNHLWFCAVIMPKTSPMYLSVVLEKASSVNMPLDGTTPSRFKLLQHFICQKNNSKKSTTA